MCALVISPGPDLIDTKTYPAQRIRYMNQHVVPQEGVTGEAAGLDYVVTQRGAGANQSIDLAPGAAWIKGDTGTRQGFYHLVNDATVNLAVPAANATNPRIDQVIATIFDSTVAGGSDVPVLSVLAGTATAGATLDNRTGAAALPNDAIRLGDILVPAASTSVVNANIRDRRQWCRGANWGEQSTGADLPTSSTSLVTTGITHRFECGGSPAGFDIGLAGVLKHDTAGASTFLSAVVDGVAQVSLRRIPTGASEEDLFSVRARVFPSAGSHVIGWYWAVSAGTATLVRTASPLSCTWEEKVAQNFVNG